MDHDLDVRYAHSGDLEIAYATFGDGPIDFVFIPGWVSHLENWWEVSASARFFRRISSFCRLIMFDKRGTGLSDPSTGTPTLEERIDDVRAVMEAAESERAFICGLSEGGPMSVMFSAAYPDRTLGLVLVGSAVKMTSEAGWEFGWTEEAFEKVIEEVAENWGQGAMMKVFLPGFVGDERARRMWARYQRMGASPSNARVYLRSMKDVDVRSILSSVQVPTLIIHRTGDMVVPVEGARYAAEQIPGATFIEQAGDDHLPWLGDADGVLDAIEEFVTGQRHDVDEDRVLATVMFTDIVGSTERAAELGDRRWRALLDAHDEISRRELERFRGRHVQSTGDGMLAVFDGPARGVRCAKAIRDSVTEVGLEIRSGLHTGECERRGDDIGGLAVHIAARVSDAAGPGEVLVSRTVRDLVVGSGLEFEDRGEYKLKGVPDLWPIYAVTRA